MPTTALHLWQPSNARVLSLSSAVPTIRSTASIATVVNAMAMSANPTTASTVGAPQPLAWPAKDPTDVLDYLLDITDALAGDTGDGIATLDVGIVPNGPGDLVLNSSSASGTHAVLWISGGQIGTTYVVTVTIGTVGGRTIARAIQLPVISLTDISTGLTGGLTTELGAVLTDQNGNPLTLGS
jgi:hypothetical protein